MKFVIATKESQGQRDNDFCHVPEGELLYPGPTCTGSIDDECGCTRSWSGAECAKGTTTMRVAEGRIESVMASLRLALERAGWYKPGGTAYELKDPPTGKLGDFANLVMNEGEGDCAYDDVTVEGVMINLTHEISIMCADFNVGDVVELREAGFRLRPVKRRRLEVVK